MNHFYAAQVWIAFGDRKTADIAIDLLANKLLALRPLSIPTNSEHKALTEIERLGCDVFQNHASQKRECGSRAADDKRRQTRTHPRGGRPAAFRRADKEEDRARQNSRKQK